LNYQWLDDARCVGAEDLERRSLQTQSFIVTQLSDVISKEVDAAVKSAAATGRASATSGSSSSSSSSSSSGGASGGAGGGQRKKSISSDNVNDARATDAALNTEGLDVATQSPSVKISGCHDLRSAGQSQTGVYSLASGKELNEAARDYNTRLCDMTTDGGGWTVTRLFISFSPTQRQLDSFISIYLKLFNVKSFIQFKLLIEMIEI